MKGDDGRGETVNVRGVNIVPLRASSIFNDSDPLRVFASSYFNKPDPLKSPWLQPARLVRRK